MKLDWKFPVAALAAAGMWLVALLWTAAHRDASLDDHERRIAKLGNNHGYAGPIVRRKQTLG